MELLRLSIGEIAHFILSDSMHSRIENGVVLFAQNDSSGSQVVIMSQEIGVKQEDQYGLIQQDDGSPV